MITNGNALRIGELTPQLPNVSSTIEGWFQDIVIGIISAPVVKGRVVETVSELQTRGVLQPLTAQQLELKPEGERSWKWYMLHCQPSLSLQTDDTVTIKGGRYRVMGRWGYDDYGYVQHELVKDYESVIPPT
jgi:hypothetical protein